MQTGPSTVLSCALLLLWIQTLTQACRGDELPRDVVLDWFKQRLLDGLGLEQPPEPSHQAPDGGRESAEAGRGHRRSTRVGRAAWAQDHRRHHQESHEQVILFPSSDSTCDSSDSPSEERATSHFTYYFQSSLNNQEYAITSAHFWFYAGEGASRNITPLFLLTSDQQLLQVAEFPAKTTADGWTTYHFEHHLLSALTQGPFVLQVRCPACECHANEADKMPFLHLHTRPHGPDRSPRRAAATIPWFPSSIDLLMRPSQQKPEYSDCQRETINISFQELGWDNWIVHPKVLNFYYCHGTCSALDRTTAILGIKQCCAPVPGTMRSLRFTTTSDGGYSFKYETLPNIIPEECTCI
ncbi:inhibin alpha chain [Oncorhynchus mykiss]|uniref:Inhibin alpha chain n=1 Tax=Oncorhynchus mykiss TaxID=8022 RepID=A0A8C7M550_ONCMY|nr:inhibin alpha chain [Oncorhynchus mykiss]